MLRYEIIFYLSNEDQAFIAEVPELLGCMAHGNDQETPTVSPGLPPSSDVLRPAGSVRRPAAVLVEAAREVGACDGLHAKGAESRHDGMAPEGHSRLARGRLGLHRGGAGLAGLPSAC